MKDQQSGNIMLELVGHDVASHTIILQLPSGTIVPATVAKANFNKHILSLIVNPPVNVKEDTLERVQQNEIIQKAIQETVKEVKEEMDDIWWDADGMFQEMRWHAKKNGRAIVLDERITQPPRLAFKCTNTNTSWSLDIKYLNEHCDRLFNSTDPAQQSKGFQLRKCISTHEGKQRLVDSINNAIK
jgi:hypothetical protein